MTALAALLLVLLGTFHVAVGLSAILTDERTPLGTGQLSGLSTRAWSWLHLVVGALVLVAGVLVLAGRAWARVVGVVVSLLSAASALALLDQHAGWTIATVVLDIVVILALTVHGSEIRPG